MPGAEPSAAAVPASKRTYSQEAQRTTSSHSVHKVQTPVAMHGKTPPEHLKTHRDCRHMQLSSVQQRVGIFQWLVDGARVSGGLAHALAAAA